METSDGLFSIRLVIADFYLEKPVPGLDPVYSEFRGREIKKVPIIRVFGSNSLGQKTCMHVHGVFPYLYIPYDHKDFDSVGRAIHQIAINLDKALNISLNQGSSDTQHVFKVQLVKGVPFYGYHRSDHQYLKIYMYNPRFVRRAANLLQNGAIMNKSFHPHESHVPYVLQFMIDYNLYGMSFIHVPLDIVKFRRTDTSEEIPFKNLQQLQLLDCAIAKKVSCCTLEVDVGSSFILNRFQLLAKNNVSHTNPGIETIWHDEKTRRNQMAAAVQDDEEKLKAIPTLEVPATQERPNIQPTESEVFYRTALLSKLIALETSLMDQSQISEQTINHTLPSNISDLTNAGINNSLLATKRPQKRTFNLVKILQNSVYPEECSQQDKLVNASFVENHLSQNNAFHKSFNSNEMLSDVKENKCSEEDESVFLDETTVDEELVLSLTQQHNTIQVPLDTTLRDEDMALLDVLQQLEEDNNEDKIDLDSSLAPLSQNHNDYALSPKLLDLDITAAALQNTAMDANADVDNEAEDNVHDFSVALESLDDLILKLTQSQVIENDAVSSAAWENVEQTDGSDDFLRTPKKSLSPVRVGKTSPRTPTTPKHKRTNLASPSRSPRTPKSGHKFKPLPLVITSRSSDKTASLNRPDNMAACQDDQNIMSLRKKLALNDLRRKSISVEKIEMDRPCSSRNHQRSSEPTRRRSRQIKDLDKTHVTCNLTPRRTNEKMLKVYNVNEKHMNIETGRTSAKEDLVEPIGSPESHKDHPHKAGDSHPKIRDIEALKSLNKANDNWNQQQPSAIRIGATDKAFLAMQLATPAEAGGRVCKRPENGDISTPQSPFEIERINPMDTPKNVQHRSYQKNWQESFSSNSNVASNDEEIIDSDSNEDSLHLAKTPNLKRLRRSFLEKRKAKRLQMQSSVRAVSNVKSSEELVLEAAELKTVDGTKIQGDTNEQKDKAENAYNIEAEKASSTLLPNACNIESEMFLSTFEIENISKIQQSKEPSSALLSNAKNLDAMLHTHITSPCGVSSDRGPKNVLELSSNPSASAKESKPYYRFINRMSAKKLSLRKSKRIREDIADKEIDNKDCSDDPKEKITLALNSDQKEQNPKDGSEKITLDVNYVKDNLNESLENLDIDSNSKCVSLKKHETIPDQLTDQTNGNGDQGNLSPKDDKEKISLDIKSVQEYINKSLEVDSKTSQDSEYVAPKLAQLSNAVPCKPLKRSARLKKLEDEKPQKTIINRKINLRKRPSGAVGSRQDTALIKDNNNKVVIKKCRVRLKKLSRDIAKPPRIIESCTFENIPVENSEKLIPTKPEREDRIIDDKKTPIESESPLHSPHMESQPTDQHLQKANQQNNVDQQLSSSPNIGNLLKSLMNLSSLTSSMDPKPLDKLSLNLSSQASTNEFFVDSPRIALSSDEEITATPPKANEILLKSHHKSLQLYSPLLFSERSSPSSLPPNRIQNASKSPNEAPPVVVSSSGEDKSLGSKLILTPLDLPPTREEVLKGCVKMQIPEYEFQQPFYSNPDDVTKAKEVGFTLLNIASNKLNDLEEFQSILGPDTKGLANWRRNQLLRSAGPEILNKYRNTQRIREYCAPSRLVVMTPQAAAPSRHEAKIWLKARELLRNKDEPDMEEQKVKLGEQDSPIKVKRQKVTMMLNDEDAGGDSDEDRDNTLDCSLMTMTPLTPNTPVTKSNSQDKANASFTPVSTKLEKIPLERLAPRKHRNRRILKRICLNRKIKEALDEPETSENCAKKENVDAIAKHSKEESVLEASEDSLAPNSQSSHTSSISSQVAMAELDRSSFMHQVRQQDITICTGNNSTLDTTFGFKVALENLQQAKADIEFNYLTIVTLELFVPTREDLFPNPQIDEIRCIFYAIENSIPNEHIDNERKLPRTSCGYIMVHDSRDILEREGRIHGIDADIQVTIVNTEVEALESLLGLCARWDPDIYAGYEIEMSSWGFVIERAKYLCLNIAPLLSRVPSQKVRDFVDEDRDQFTDLDVEMKLCGRILLDVWRLMRSEIALTSYTFENVMYHILHKRCPWHSYRTLSEWFASPSCRWIVIEYYLERVRGTLSLLDQLDLIGRTSEMAKLIGIQFYEVLSRGSQFRVESMMLRIAKPKNLVPLSPSVQQRAHMRAPEYLPLILEPQSRFYPDPLIVLDFQSLYPSMIIAYNYCYSTCLGRVEHLGQSTPFEFGASQLRVSPSMLRKLLDQDLVTISPCGVVFIKASVREGILPRMLTEILDTRQMVKQSMKLHKTNSALQRILHSRQLGLKLMANTTYGYTAANFSGRMPAVEVGDSVVAKGRETLERAIKMVEANEKWRVKVVYGDTDSLFVLVPGRNREEAFRIGEEIAETITQQNPQPVKLKLEKVYQPCILQTKKRYVGYMYETADQKEPIYEAKGIETVRRDGCPIVAKMLEKVLRILFETADVSQVKQYVCRHFTKLLSGRANLQDLIFAKEFRGLNGYKPTACVPALELTRKWMQSDPRRIPRRGERVPFIVTNGPPGLPLIRLIRHPHELLADEGLKINAIYYITKAIIPPLNRCLLLIGADVNEWFANLPRKILMTPALSVASEVIACPNNPKLKKSTISQFFSTTNCLADCGRHTKQGICEQCQAIPGRSMVVVQMKMAKFERSFLGCQQICQACCGRVGDLKCGSLDCPVVYVMEAKRRDLQQIGFLRNVLQDKFEPIKKY